MQPKFAKSEDAKKAGWFSRRHRTRDAHDAYMAKRSDKLARAAERNPMPSRLAAA